MPKMQRMLLRIGLGYPPPISDVEFRRVIDGKAASESEAPMEVLPRPPRGRARR